MFINSGKGAFALRQGAWKLLLDNHGGDKKKKNPKDKPVTNSDEILLFNLVEDPKETQNLSLRYPERVTQLKKLLAKVVLNGRSTPGPKIPIEDDLSPKNWPQLNPIREYLGDKFSQ